MSLDSGTNNIHFNMPPLMNDGRNFASWQPEAVINQKLQNEAGIHSNWSYREYLQKNANKIMKYNHMEAIASSGNNPNTYHNINSNINPFVFNSIHDNNRPVVGYNNSDLKQNYLSREQLNARLVSPSIPTVNFS
jgi:hypothetical protein